MGLAGFAGLLLLGAGPIASVFLVCLARKSFLVLLALAGAFYWLVTLFVISALFRGWAPLSPSVGPYAGLVVVAVLIQEVARVGVWRFHRLSERALDSIARQSSDAPLSAADRFGLALAHGLSHGGTHSLFFFVSWLPLSLGDGTIYSEHCPRMSYYLVGALSTLGFAALLTAGMIVALEGLERRDPRPACGTAAAHLGAALLTLGNFAHDGCMVTVPLLLAGGAVAAAWAGRLWWRRTLQVPGLAPAATQAARGGSDGR
eukprot:scaffold15.g4267.t1